MKLPPALSAVVAKVDATLELNPRLLGWVLIAAGGLLVFSAFEGSRRKNDAEG